MNDDLGELLLRWVSERGEGSTESLIDSIRWLARAHGLNSDIKAAYRWIGRAMSLAHLDVDWQARRWCAAPPTLTALPYSDGLAVLAGARTARTEERLAKASADWLELVEVPDQSSGQSIPAPRSLLIAYDNPADLPDYADRLGASWTPCFALQVGPLLRPLDLGPEDTVPASTAAVQRWNSTRRAFVDVAEALGDGLYRARRIDGVSYLLCRGGTWRRTTRQNGIYHCLATEGINVLRWRPEGGVGRSKIGRLSVDDRFALPQLHQRTATMCLGVPPASSGGATDYANVPRALAEQIAASLSQHLIVTPS